MLNRIWIAFVLVGFAAAVVQTAQGDLDLFSRLLGGLFDTAKTGFDIALGLTGVMSLWLGIMKIGERGGLIPLFGRLVAPFFRRIFPDIPPGHPAATCVTAPTTPAPVTAEEGPRDAHRQYHHPRPRPRAADRPRGDTHHRPHAQAATRRGGRPDPRAVRGRA